MNQRIASIAAYIGSVAVATLAAAIMSGNAFAESPLDDSKAPFVSARSRAEVKAELAGDRQDITSYASEWVLQQGESPAFASGYTRAQARADYIAARDQVHAMTAEDGGSFYLARMAAPVRAGSMLASNQR
jgi:hypothetical protein